MAAAAAAPGVHFAAGASDDTHDMGAVAAVAAIIVGGVARQCHTSVAAIIVSLFDAVLSDPGMGRRENRERERGGEHKGCQSCGKHAADLFH